MKTVIHAFALFVASATVLPALAADEVAVKPAAQTRIGVVTASGSNLGELVSQLNAKATAEGAGSYRVISAGGQNHLYGSAEIYK